MSQRPRDLRRRDLRKAQKYGAWAVGLDLRGRHGHHVMGPANPRYIDGRFTNSVKASRARALAAGLCPRCFRQPAAVPKRQCVACLAYGRLRAGEAYALRRMERMQQQERRATVRQTPAIIAGYVPPVGSIAWSLLGRVVRSHYGDAHA